MSLCSLLLGDVWPALGPGPSEPPPSRFIAFLSLQVGEFIIPPTLLLHPKGQCSQEDPGEGCKGWGSDFSGGVMGRQ